MSAFSQLTRIKSIPILQAAKVLGLTGLMMGGLASCLGLVLVFVISTESPVVTLTVLISLPLAGGLFGFAGTAAFCWLYNSHAQWFGGLLLDLQAETAASLGTSQESENSGPSSGQGESPGGGQRAPVEQQSIKVYRIKLGPAGLGEWVDVRNDGPASVSTSGLCLYHLEYPRSEGEPEYRFVVTLPECFLRPGEILRVHSGPRQDLSSLHSEDRTGADRRVFTGGETRIWNRREGDTAVLYSVTAKEVTDSAFYESNPPEDVVLLRRGPKLMPTPIGAAASRR